MLRDHAIQLFDLALDGARRSDVVDGDSLELAEDFRSRLTRRGLDPGDEAGDLAG